jgi:hypothetical protein
VTKEDEKVTVDFTKKAWFYRAWACFERETSSVFFSLEYAVLTIPPQRFDKQFLGLTGTTKTEIMQTPI